MTRILDVGCHKNFTRGTDFIDSSCRLPHAQEEWAWQKGRQEMEKEMQSKYDIYEYGAVAKLQEKARQEGKMEALKTISCERKRRTEPYEK